LNKSQIYINIWSFYVIFICHFFILQWRSDIMYYIYKIENLINHKIYIGLTNNIIRRRNRHFTDLRCNRHDNSFL
jgi:hypothetical protein